MGDRDGRVVGFLVGANDGLKVGERDGLVVGANDGFLVGADDGFLVGAFVGAFVGAKEGALVGFIDGENDGLLVVVLLLVPILIINVLNCLKFSTPRPETGSHPGAAEKP